MFADSGVTDSALAVFKLVLNESADFVLHSGDFDYNSDPGSWEAFVNASFGDSFPFFAVVGNHDLSKFYSNNGYQV